VDLGALTLNKHSHQIFDVSCDFKISEKCRKNYTMEFRQYVKLTNNNLGKLPCIFCSRTLKFSGRNNPNTKYKSINDNFFNQIDTNDKAYLLGWIASDGHIGERGFKISIHQKDIEILNIFQKLICLEVPIRKFETDTSKMCSFEINSKQISKDLCLILNIKPGKKSNTVNFPILNTDHLHWSFIRGYFDGDGSINSQIKSKYPYAKGNIKSNSDNMLNGIRKFCKLNGKITCSMISITNNVFLNFLDQMYAVPGFKLERKYNRYVGWKNHNAEMENHGNI